MNRFQPAVPSRRGFAAWLGLLAALVAFDGAIGAAIAVVMGGALLYAMPVRWLIAAGAALIAAVPIVVLSRGLPTPATLSSSYALHDQLANAFALAGLAMFVTGSILEGLRQHAESGDTGGITDPSDAPTRQEYK